jgi:hypothetical protein
MTHKSEEISSSEMLDVLLLGKKTSPIAWTSFYGGIGITKVQVLIKNLNFYVFSLENPDPDPDPHWQNAGAGSESASRPIRIHNTGTSTKSKTSEI